MPFWDDEDFTPYEQGGITGGIYKEPGGYAGIYPDQPGSTAPVSFDALQQVGHDGTINGMTREQYRDAWQGSGAKSIDDLKAFVAQHGGRVLSDNGTVLTPFGETMDLGQNARGAAAGHGQMTASWGGVGGPDPGGSGPPSAASGAMVQNALSAAMGGGGTSGGGSVNTGRAMPAEFQWQNFDPNSVDMSKDPGVAFRMSEAQKAMQNSAASKGTLFSGGFAKALNNRTQDYASQEYGSAFQRALGVNQANNQGGLGAYQANVNAALGQGNLDLGYQNSNNQYSLGLGNLALGNKSADQSYDLGLRNNALGYTQAGNAYSLGQGQLGLGWANYGLNADDQNFGQGYKLATLGQNSAAQAGSYGSSYGANQGNTYMQQGANAGNAKLAGANAWSQAIGNGITNGLGAYYMSQGYGAPANGAYKGSGFYIPG